MEPGTLNMVNDMFYWYLYCSKQTKLKPPKMKNACYKAHIFLVFFTFLTIISSAQQTGLDYICPVPGSKYLNPEQNIILKTLSSFDPGVLENANVYLLGSKSGIIEVDFLLSGDQQTLVIKPGGKFSLDEKVTVRVTGLRTIDSDPIPDLEFVFYTKEKELGEVPSFDEGEMGFTERGGERTYDKPPGNSWWLDNSLPPDFPGPITSTSGYVDNRYTFTNLDARMLGASFSNYSVILDNFGTPIYYQKTANRNYFNLHVMPNGLLAWCKNFATNSSNEKYYIADSSYAIIDSVRTGNGYNLDSHDMLWMSNGHYLVMSYDPQPVNMSLIVPGGNPDAIVTGLIIQEVDNDENVYWQWRSWDHFEITDATSDISLTASNIDYCHGNAFEFDDDGHLLLSSRNMDEITKIDYNTGELIWRFGKNASNNQFDIIGDPIGFTHQHDIRKMPNGHYTLYDNGNLHQSQFSRPMEYDINEDDMTATLIWHYTHEPLIYAPVTGSYRVLENEKKIIGWGGTGMENLITELNADNSVSMELFVPGSVTSYRSLKYAWETNKFSTVKELSFGNFAGHDDPKELYLFINNNSGGIINITSTYNHLSAYEVITQLPLGIFPNTSAMITIAYDPLEPGEYNDLLTLNYDNDDNSRRIARQLTLNGFWEDEAPSASFNPANGVVNVDPATDIQVMFTEPVRHEGGDEILDEDIPDIFILREQDKEGLDVTFSGFISDDKMTITIYPSSVLKEEQLYYVELLADTVEDYEGNVARYAEGSFFETGLVIGITEMAVHEIDIYPNPCADAVRLRYLIHDIGYLIFDLFDISGRKICRNKGKQVLPGEHEIEIDLSDVPAGVYFLRMQAGDEVVVRKVVKME